MCAARPISGRSVSWSGSHLLGPDLPPQQRQATQALDIPITPPTSGSPAMNLSRSASPRPQQTSPISAYPSSQQPTSQGMAATAAAAAAAVAAKQPNVEIYGFVIYLGSFIGYVAFILWAFLPDETLHQLGISYYPSKWWALSLPVYVLVVAAFIFVFYVSYSFLATQPLDSIHTVTDEYANVIENLGSQAFKHEEKVPELLDIPISVVNKCLYQGVGGVDSLNQGRQFSR